MRVLLTAAVGLTLASPGFAATDKQPPSRMPSEMTPTEIKAYNADIDKAHPHYITCRKTEVIGSLARKLRVCRTNAQWKEASTKGNENARELTEEFARKGSINSN